MSKLRCTKTFVLKNIKHKKLNESRNLELAIEMQKGSSKARTELIETNMILVKNIVDNFYKNNEQYQDLLQSGYLGLIYAVDRYNYTKGPLIPYATNWVNKYIRLSLYEISNLIEMPEEISRISMVIAAVRNKIYSEIGRTPTYDEIYDDSDIQKLVKQGKVHKSNIKTLLKLSSYESLDVPISDEYDTCHIDILADDSLGNVDDDIISDDLIDECLRTLNDNGKLVVKMYLGLDGKGSRSFQQISDEIGLTKQRCSGIYAESIARLKKRFSDSNKYTFWEKL